MPDASVPFQELNTNRVPVNERSTLPGISALAISYFEDKESGGHRRHRGRGDLILLMASAVLSVVISLFSAEHAMFAYFLNFAKPLMKRWEG